MLSCCFCALLFFVPCSVLCFALYCSSLSSSVLLCSVGLFCFAAKPCFLPCFAHKLSWLCFAYECFGAQLFSYFGLPSVLVLCIFCLCCFRLSDVLLLPGTLGQLPDAASLAHAPTFKGQPGIAPAHLPLHIFLSFCPHLSKHARGYAFPKGCKENTERAVC